MQIGLDAIWLYFYKEKDRQFQPTSVVICPKTVGYFDFEPYPRGQAFMLVANRECTEWRKFLVNNFEIWRNAADKTTEIVDFCSIFPVVFRLAWEKFPDK